MLHNTLIVAHVIGIALGVGGASVKLVLLFRTRRDHTLIPAFIHVMGTITGLILAGAALLSLSGIGWLLDGYPLSPELIVKLVMFAATFVIGATLGKVVEPKFRQLAPSAATAAAPGFARVHAQYLALEVAATGLYYAILVFWLFFLNN